MKNQRKNLRWALLLPVFALVLSLLGSTLLLNRPVYAAGCDTAYSNTNSPEYKLCNEAYTRATDDTYCDQYVGKAAYDPCYVGQMSKLGQNATPPGQANANIYTASGVESWCNNKYGTNTSEAKICQEGAKNMGVNNYCERYSGAAGYGPCKAGWDEARRWAKQNGANVVNTTPANPTTNTGDTTCVVPYVGWAICPILLAVSKGVDAAYNVVEDILETPVSIFTESATNGVGEVYGKFLSVANIALAIIFLVVIIAQAIPGFLPNYTLKKYMPKLLIAAVALNLAFYACAAMVDVVNIIGRSIPGFFSGMSAQTVNHNVPSNWSVPVIGDLSTGNANNFGDFTGSILAGTAIIGGVAIFSAGGLAPIGWAILMFLLPIVLGAIVAILAILLALVLRSALIIVLIVISPLAFAAMALPNTEGLFKKWWGLFYKLLFLYPIVALVFGGSKLAGSVLMNVATASAGSATGAFLAMAASAAAILPLILVPGIMKGAVSATGKLGQKIEGMTDKGYSGAKSLADKRMKESGVGQYYAKKTETDKGLKAGGYKLGERKRSLRNMPNRQDWRRAHGTSIANKLDEDYAKGYELLLNKETAGMSFPDQISYYQGEFVKASRAGDFAKANIIMTNKLGKTGGGRKALKQAMAQHSIGATNSAFDNKIKGAIAMNKDDFVKDAQIFQFATNSKGYDINEMVHTVEIGLTDADIAKQSARDMTNLLDVDAARAEAILANRSLDLNSDQRAQLEHMRDHGNWKAT
ncbi:hypothetical protein FWF93_02690 [Candidatus Saccharibacteria bacterium]|nr:hypothetical protein [Candidatus Saccharibacteria bacterium]